MLYLQNGIVSPVDLCICTQALASLPLEALKDRIILVVRDPRCYSYDSSGFIDRVQKATYSWMIDTPYLRNCLLAPFASGIHLISLLIMVWSRQCTGRIIHYQKSPFEELFKPACEFQYKMLGCISLPSTVCIIPEPKIQITNSCTYLLFPNCWSPDFFVAY